MKSGDLYSLRGLFNDGLVSVAYWPYRYKIADFARWRNSPQFSVGRVDFIGALTHPNTELGDFRIAYVHINAISAFAMIIGELDFDISDAFWNTSFVADSARRGDSLSGTWRILAHGVFHPFHTSPRQSQSIRLLSEEYCRCGFGPIAEFHTINVPIVRNIGVGMVARTSPTGTDPFLSISATFPFRPMELG